MEKVRNALNELLKINDEYELSNEEIEKLLSDMETAKVCTPVIGKFSSGKSALLNRILGYSRKLLKEDITPETAVPAEITYGPEDRISMVENDGSTRTLNGDEYRQLEVDANTVKHTSLCLRNEFLKEIPDVMLVDMPGFESGFEVHNRAIDSYLPRSLAYIIAFPADDLVVRSSVGNILKELCLHDMPICIVVTKYDKRGDDFDNTYAVLKESLKRYIGNREVADCITSSFDGDVEELENFLRDVQKESQSILAAKFRKAALPLIENTENYLAATLKNSELTASELDEQGARLGDQLDTLNSRFEKEKGDFDIQIADCVEEIKDDVQMALEGEESSFVAMVMNNQSINEKLNLVVRSAVTSSIKKRFIPKVEKYLKRVSNCINSEAIGDVHVPVHFDPVDVGKDMVSTAVAAVAGLILGGPIIAGIVAGVVALVNKIRGDKKREEIKQQIRTKLRSEVYPQVLKEVGKGIEDAVTKQLKLVNTSIEEEIENQRNTLKKAIEDVKKRADDEKERKENREIDMREDLERLAQIKNSMCV